MPDKDKIQQFSETVYNVLSSSDGYSFTALEELSGIRSVDLCFALMYLMKENKVKQEIEDNIVLYKIENMDIADDVW